MRTQYWACSDSALLLTKWFYTCPQINSIRNRICVFVWFGWLWRSGVVSWHLSSCGQRRHDGISVLAGAAAQGVTDNTLHR